MKPGMIVYLIANKTRIKEAVILKISGEFCTIRFPNGGGIRIRSDRLYLSREEAEQSIIKSGRKIQKY